MEEISSLEKNSIIREVYSISTSMRCDVFLVGGLLRDLLLNLSYGNDFDFVVNLDKHEIRKVVTVAAHEMKGTYFPLDAEEGIYRIVIKKGSSHHATLTREDDRNNNATIVDLSPLKGGNIITDLRQRDFTVDAMALNLGSLFQQKDVQLIDPLGGLKDLKKSLLRASSPHVFAEDPVRLIRAYRISALCGLTIEKETREVIRNEHGRLRSSSWERIRDELFLILEARNACHHIQGLSSSGLLAEIICDITGKGFSHEGTFPTVSAVENILEKKSQLTPTLCSELTKYLTESLGGISKMAYLKFLSILCDLWAVSAQEDVLTIVSEYISSVRTIGKKIKLSNRGQLLLTTVWRSLGKAQNLLISPKLKDVDMYYLFRDSGKDGILLTLLAVGTLQASGKSVMKETQHASTLINYYFDTYREFLEAPLLNGSDIMHTFGISQGEKIGEILQSIEKARAEGHVISKREALEFIKGTLGQRKL